MPFRIVKQETKPRSSAEDSEIYTLNDEEVASDFIIQSKRITGTKRERDNLSEASCKRIKLTKPTVGIKQPILFNFKRLAPEDMKPLKVRVSLRVQPKYAENIKQIQDMFDSLSLSDADEIKPSIKKIRLG